MQSITPQTATASFPRFAELPTEIRLKIWQLWISPRWIYYPQQLAIERKFEYWAMDDSRRHIKPATPGSAIPLALLGVNKESHFVMSEFYKKSFGLTKYTGGQISKGAREDIHGVVFNADIDTLFLHQTDVNDFSKYCSDGLHRLRYAAVYVIGINAPVLFSGSVFPAIWRLFGKCARLERVYLCLCGQLHEYQKYVFERGLQYFWIEYKLEGAYTEGIGLEDASSRWRNVVRVMYMNQSRKATVWEGDGGSLSEVEAAMLLQVLRAESWQS